MISNLREVAKKIAAEKGIYWGSNGLDWKFKKMDMDVVAGKISKEEAVKIAANDLKIERIYDKDFKALENAVR